MSPYEYQIGWTQGYLQAMTELQEKQRKKGQWVHGKELSKSYIGNMCIGINYEDWRCSECDIAVETYDKPKWNFCPNCGAEMQSTIGQLNDDDQSTKGGEEE